MSHEVTKTWEIDGKYHVKPSVGANKGETLKIFNTEEAANKWAEQRSRNYKPEENMADEYISMIERLTPEQIKKVKKNIKKTQGKWSRGEWDMETGPNTHRVEDPNPRKKKKKSRGPVAAMPGSHKQNRMRY